ncbi:hypothetical protein Lesp02_20220 [Lentzea sp. NBRC 105346]|uniref:hypothetical protein n=1 Tax=Lentzea sp. NBRC 105346 TaxID=3032205 RepID=UPI0024A19E2A|nr:hypothetical protein [Lentzea sp. NBRC 105346]GLZ29832.1 hypothetical protein Lesp02_20220 [Lentzea sp. NBRC 105346]
MTATDPADWPGARPFSELLQRFRPNSGQVELNVHTAWALLLAQPWLLQSRPPLCTEVVAAIGRLDEDDDLSADTRRELSDIAYAVRLAQR